MILKISQVALLVLDYEEAIAFYCKKLGFKVIEDSELEAKRWIRIGAQTGSGSEILLSKATTPEQKQAVGNQAGGRVFLYLHTDNFQSDFESFQKQGIDFTEGPVDQPYGMVAVFKDLYGNRIDLIQPKL